MFDFHPPLPLRTSRRGISEVDSGCLIMKLLDVLGRMILAIPLQGNKCPPGMMKVISPISGATIISTNARGVMKDPLTGSKLRLVGGV